MFSTFSREPGAGSLPTDSSDSAQSVMSKSSRTVRRSSKRGKLTAYSMWLPSSETCGSSFALAQVNAIGALRIWLREAFPANPSPSQENARGVPTPAIFGLSSPKWCGKFDPDTCSLRTCQDSLPGMEDATSGASLVTWPRSGTVSDGVCWELTMSVPRTGARGSGYWPSPRGSDGEKGGPNQRGSKGDRMLPSAVMWLTPSVEDAGRQGKAENWRQYEEGGRTTQARLRNQVMWPTPQAEDSHHGGRSMSPRGVQKRLTEGRQLDLGQTVALRGGPLTRQTYPTPKGSPSGPDYARTNRPESGGDDLATAIARKTYPTPRASDGPPRSSHNRTWSTTDKNLHTVVAKPEGGQLNPEWVEWLMGWPIGWTALEPLAMDRYQRWLRLHGNY